MLAIIQLISDLLLASELNLLKVKTKEIRSYGVSYIIVV